MFGALTGFVSTQQGDSAEFMEKVRTLVIGVARERELAHLYVPLAIRPDSGMHHLRIVKSV